MEQAALLHRKTASASAMIKGSASPPDPAPSGRISVGFKYNGGSSNG
jgi:hypothetical protein